MIMIIILNAHWSGELSSFSLNLNDNDNHSH
jgi:hypothetical protein